MLLLPCSFSSPIRFLRAEVTERLSEIIFQETRYGSISYAWRIRLLPLDISIRIFEGKPS